DATRAEHLRHVVDELTRLADGPPLVGVSIDRTDELRVAVPAAFADVDLAAQIFDVGPMRRRHRLALDGHHRFGPGQRLFEIGNQSLAGHGQRVEAERRDQDHRFDAVQVYLLPFLKTISVPANNLPMRPRAPELACRVGWSCRDSRIRVPPPRPW